MWCLVGASVSSNECAKLTPSIGEVRLFGAPPRDVKDRWRLGYVPQRPVLGSEVPATVEEIVATGRLARRGWWRPLRKEDRDAARHALVHLMHDHGAGVLLVSHELSAVAGDLDRVVVLKGTVLFDGPPSRLTDEGVSLGVHREDLPLWLEGLH